MCKIIDMFTKEEIKIGVESQEVQELLDDILTVIRTSESLTNEYCSISFDEAEKSISGSDSTDSYNLPCFYTKNKRSIKKAWDDLTKKFTAKTKMYDAVHILNEYNLRCHTYCSMD